MGVVCYHSNTKTYRYIKLILLFLQDIPRQQNGSDCGVFVCQFAKWLCSRSKSRSYSRIPFQQRDMPGFRETMLGELKNGTLHPSSR